MNKRALLSLLAVLSFAGMAAAQQPYSCTVASSPQPIRDTGVAEYVADAIVTCSGGDTSSTVPASITITLNATITSRIGADNYSEAILLIDEAVPNSRITGVNVFKGLQVSANSIRFDNVSVFEPGSPRTYRFSNIRVDASGLAPGTFAPAPVLAQVSTNANTPISVNPVQVGFVQQAQNFSVRSCDDSQASFINFSRSDSQNASLANGTTGIGNIQFNVRFRGNFVGAYRRLIDPAQDPTTPGIQYNSESDFVDTTVLGPVSGVATQGTRLMSRFTNIPAGVRLFVTTTPLAPGGASSTSLSASLLAPTDANGAGSSGTVSGSAYATCAPSRVTAVVSELTVVNGTALAVWEVTNSSPTAVETASFGVAVAYISTPTLPAAGTVNAAGLLGPLSTLSLASATAPAPRFAASPITVPAFAIGAITTAPLTITTASPLPSGQVNVPYSLPSFTASGGTSPYAWSVTQASVLPPGLTLLSNGTFSGTPTTAGTYSFTIQVTDQANANATKLFTIDIANAAAPNITTASPLPSGQVASSYTPVQFTATGLNGPITWTALTSPPAGLTLSNSGVLSGTPTTAGTYSFTIQVTGQGNASATKVFAIDIANSAAPNITTASPLPTGQVGSSYTPVQFTATGLNAPITWTALTSPPAGLTLSNSGLLSGTPITQGTSTFNVRAASGSLQTSKQFSITINSPPAIVITIAPATIPSGTVGNTYSQQLTASGGIGSYTFSLASGSLPSGLNLSSGGLISGTLLAQGGSSFTVQAADSQGHTGSQGYSVSVTPPVVVTPPDNNNGISITTRSIPNGALGADYAVTLAATGGVLPYTWAADTQSLPPGVTFSSGGVLSGKPTRAGSFRISVSVTDPRGSGDGTVFPMTVTGPPLSITTTSLTNGTVGATYSGSVQATGGIPPYTFSVITGSLPAGLSFAADGTITGTPAAGGSSSFTVQVTDAAQNPQGKVTRALSITVTANPPVITTTSLTNGVVNVPYSGSVAATGGVPPYTFSVASGSLPAGLQLGSGGDITGTPTALGDLSVTVQVTDKLKQTANKGFSLRIVAPPLISTNSAVGLLVTGTASGLTLAATGGTLPYTWSVTGGSLPAGASLDPTSGAISGTPTAAGPYSFTATIVDANKLTASKTFTGRVSTPVRITTASPLPAATLGVGYSQKIDSTGGTIPYRFSADTLPAGLSIDSSGLITGSPTALTPGAFGVTVTDSDGLTATSRFTLAVGLPQVSGVTIGGVTDTPPANGQQPVTLALGNAFPVPITGTVTLSFTSDANVPSDDPMVRFSASPAPDGRTANFTVAADNTAAVFTTPNLGIQTGTVSGTITLTTTLQSESGPVSCNCALTRTIRVAKGVPVISSVRAVRSAGAITITIIGFSTTRELTQAAFQFTTAAGSNVQTTSFTVPVSTFFTTWYTSTQSTQFGSQFLLTEPFTIQGDANAVTNVSVTLTNTQGASQPTSAAVQ